MRRTRIVFKTPAANGSKWVHMARPPAEVERKISEAQRRGERFISGAVTADTRNPERVIVPISNIAYAESSE